MTLSKIAAALSLVLLVITAPASLHAQREGRSARRRGQFAFIHSMVPAANGGFTIAVDYAELLSGDAAEHAAREDGQASPKNLSGLHIENRTQVLRTLRVPAWAQVYLLLDMQPTLVKPAVLYRLLQGETSSFGAFWGFPYRCEGEDAYCLPVRITQRSGQVLRIEQEYLP